MNKRGGKKEDEEEPEGELDRILKQAVGNNSTIEWCIVKQELLRAWQLLLEITLSKCYDHLKSASREGVLYDLLDSLLERGIKEQDTTNTIAEQMSESVVSLLSKIQENNNSNTNNFNNNNYNNSNSNNNNFNVIIEGEEKRIPENRCNKIVDNILKCLINRRGMSSRLREYLYIALLYYLQLTTPSFIRFGMRSNNYSAIQKDRRESEDDSNEDEELQEENYREEMKRDKYESKFVQEQQFLQSNFEILKQAIERGSLMDHICNDAVHEVGIRKLVALATIDAINAVFQRAVSNEQDFNWLKSSYLRHFLNAFDPKGALSLRAVDNFNHLTNSINSNNNNGHEVDLNFTNLNESFYFSPIESRSQMMTVLRSVQTSAGASLLCENGLLKALIDCSYIDLRPNYSVVALDSNFMNTDFNFNFITNNLTNFNENRLVMVTIQYHELLIPILQILVSLFVSFRKDGSVLNQIIVQQIVEFVNVHQILLGNILKDVYLGPSLSVYSLEEIHWTTALFFHLQTTPFWSIVYNYSNPIVNQNSDNNNNNNNNNNNPNPNPNFENNEMKLMFKELMMDVFTRFCTREYWKSIIIQREEDEDFNQFNQPSSNFFSTTNLKTAQVSLQICRNVIGFARLVTISNNLVFSPKPHSFHPSTIFKPHSEIQV